MILAGSAAIAQNATFDPARLSQHIQTLGSDAFEGRGPATAGETKTVDYLAEQFARPPASSPAATWSTASALDPGRAAAPVRIRRRAAGQHRHRRQGRRPLTQGEQIAVRAPTNGDKAMIDRRRAARVRRLRRQGAGAQLGRFQGRRPPGQDPRHAGQRPRLRGRRRRFRRQGDDLLRPLDLQVRGRRAPGRRRRAGRSTRPSRPPTAGRRSRTPTPTPCSTSSARIPRPSIRRSKAGSSATSPRSCSRRRAQLRGDEGGRQAQGLQAGPAQGHARRPRRRQDRGDHLAQRRRHPARHRAPGRDGDLHRRTGTISASACPTPTATASTMARSTTAPASPN